MMLMTEEGWNLSELVGTPEWSPEWPAIESVLLHSFGSYLRIHPDFDWSSSCLQTEEVKQSGAARASPSPHGAR